jgi:SAM-dependent methyltransferase
MHEASFEKMRAFRYAYLADLSTPVRVLDIGGGGHDPAQTYRPLFPAPTFEYVSLDLVESPHTDIVPKDIFSWEELAAESFDVVISGQTFEHNPLFWITAAEIARVLTQGGLAAVIAPSTGEVHRYPFDCWRFYPDSWGALTAYVGLELEESYVEVSAHARVLHGLEEWHDALMVARKPALADGEAEAFYDRLARIVSTGIPLAARDPQLGAAASAYERAHRLGPGERVVRRLELMASPLFSTTRMPTRYRKRYWAHVRRVSRDRGAAGLPWPADADGATRT